ncbi:hypothetical protein V8G54_034553 [Vigna mungo]|uniref:VQ domain-containing protein n=1 Tax=Vigna mungo TaxID=3915 RepID=A0AAQ3MQV9_VIGMU
MATYHNYINTQSTCNKSQHSEHLTTHYCKLEAVFFFLMGEAPKIVQIETRYVQTDAVNFRDVVQSLTGKNSSTDWIGTNVRSAAESCSKGGIPESKEIGTAAAASAPSAATYGTNETLLPPPFSSSTHLLNNISFKDFDGFMLPPTELMPWSYSYT